MSSTRSPTAARAVARLIAVVVLPTPPFRLAIAKTFGPVCGDAKEDGVTIRYAGERLGLNLPIFMRHGQFLPPPFSLVEKANSALTPVPVGPNQQLTERREGPGGNDVCAGRR